MKERAVAEASRVDGARPVGQTVGYCSCASARAGMSPQKKSSKTTTGSKAKPVEFDADEDTEPVEDYPHGSLAHGDVPPPWVAAAMENQLRDNPYKDRPQHELAELAVSLYRASEQLRLVESVLQARKSAW